MSRFDPDRNWTGNLYQFANRLAHLYFFRKRANVQAWLVNVYFTDDPSSPHPTSRADWAAALSRVKEQLGLEHTSVRFCGIDLLENGQHLGLIGSSPNMSAARM